MKKFLEKQVVFNVTLRVFVFFAQRRGFSHLTQWATTQAAKLNLALNRPKSSTEVEKLAQTWQDLMPPDGQAYFPIKEVNADTAFTEIHLACPLRGTGNVHACYKLMNYDRELTRKAGGELSVRESQSNSRKNYCRLAIRPLGSDTSDLVAAHEQRDV